MDRFYISELFATLLHRRGHLGQKRSHQSYKKSPKLNPTWPPDPSSASIVIPATITEKSAEISIVCWLRN